MKIKLWMQNHQFHNGAYHWLLIKKKKKGVVFLNLLLIQCFTDIVNLIIIL